MKTPHQKLIQIHKISNITLIYHKILIKYKNLFQISKIILMILMKIYQNLVLIRILDLIH